MLKTVLSILSILFCALSAKSYTVEEIPNVHVADKTQYVSNPDGILSANAVDSINNTISDIWTQTSAEVVAVVVKTIGSDVINVFDTRLLEHWGIGKKDKSNGLLILVVEDQHKAVIRTGYGAEGLLPDIVCGRIIRNIMVPSFRNGNYDEGMVNTVTYMHKLLTTPGAIEELKSQYANDRPVEIDTAEIWNIYIAAASFLAAIMFLYVIFLIVSSRKKDLYERYYLLSKLRLPLIIVAFITIGLGLPAFLLLLWACRYCRNKRRKCPNCHSKMHKLSETDDNKYLTPAQDLEEKLNSVDYDVWLCDNCGEVDIFPFINKNTSYQECPICHAKAMMLTGDRLLESPSIRKEGRGVKIYHCRNCGNNTNIPYSIPRNEAPVIVPFIGGFGHGDNGGFGGGGSFGGGMTGGGGASGSW